MRMKKAKFKIGDRVETNWIGIGKVTDIMYSAHKDEYIYEATNEENSSAMFSEDELTLVPEEKNYSMTIQIDIAQNVVIATLFSENDDIKSPLAKGHAHIIHEGDLGIAQAASFACKRLYQSLGGEITKGGSWR
jgi:uncharacterized FAD-dependent dehydrogenase